MCIVFSGQSEHFKNQKSVLPPGSKKGPEEYKKPHFCMAGMYDIHTQKYESGFLKIKNIEDVV